MANTKWLNGIPTKDGLYWFDSLGDGEHTMVLQMRRGHGVVYGHHGSGPLSMFYHPKLTRAGHKEIAELTNKPWEWYSATGKGYAWAKDPKGYTGFFLVNREYCRSDELGGGVIYLDHPTSGGVFGGTWYKRDGWLFQPVKKPRRVDEDT
jgi:hypothetical protein